MQYQGFFTKEQLLPYRNCICRSVYMYGRKNIIPIKNENDKVYPTDLTLLSVQGKMCIDISNPLLCILKSKIKNKPKLCSQKLRLLPVRL